MDPKDKKPPVASAVVIKHSEFPDLILHGKRKDTNQWSIPGGHVHKDESLKDAAVRETKEETGLELNPDDLEHIGSEHYNTQEDKNLVVHLFVCKKPYHHESMDFTGDKDEEFKELKFINPLDHDDLYRPNGENIVVTYLKGELKKPEVKKAEKLDKGKIINPPEIPKVTYDSDEYISGISYTGEDESLKEAASNGKHLFFPLTSKNLKKVHLFHNETLDDHMDKESKDFAMKNPEIARKYPIVIARHSDGSLHITDGQHRFNQAIKDGKTHVKAFIFNVPKHYEDEIQAPYHISEYYPQFKKAEDDYKGEHAAPTSTSGAPMHDLKNTYPDDIYSPEATRYYGHGVPYDNESVSVIQNTKNKPNRPVKIYRAVPHVQSNLEQIQDLESQKAYILKRGKIPKHVTTDKDRSDYYAEISNKIEQLKSLPETSKEKLKINVGDWVTTSKKYAMEHGQANLGGKYKIISKTVPAKHLFTDGNSIHEWGYDPQVSKSEIKNLEIYQFFHDVTDDLIKVEIKDKNNLQAAKATFKIELGDIVVPEEVRVNDKHKTSDLAKEMYNYVNEVINLTKQELEKMSRPVLRFSNIKGLPTRPEEQVKLISRRKYFKISDNDKTAKPHFFGPKGISQENAEYKKLANKTASKIGTERVLSPIEVSEKRKDIENQIKDSREKASSVGFLLEVPTAKISQPYIYDQESENQQIKEGKITPEEAGRSYESTKEHEATHYLLSEIQNHPEFSKLHRIALVDKLIGFISPENKNALEKYLIYKKYSPKDENFKEEMLNHARDFLVSEHNRKDLQELLEEENKNEKKSKNFLPINLNSLKKEWQKITNYAKKLTPFQLHNIADDYADRGKYIKKNENIVNQLNKKEKPKVKNFRRFFLKRKIDHSGNSGTGIVAVGIQFPNRKCLINWMTDTPSFNFYDSLDDIKEVHGHDGDTEIHFMDDLNKTELNFVSIAKGFEDLFAVLAKAKGNIMYVATDGDNIGASVERAALSNDIKEIKKQDKIIKKGNQVIRKWINERKGSIYIDGGDDISFIIHKRHLDEIEDLRNKYHEATGYTITVGVGDSISEAAHAMIYGKLKGKNQVNKWTPEIESIISQHDKKPETAEEKYQKEGLLTTKQIK